MDPLASEAPTWRRDFSRVSAGGPRIPKGASQGLGWAANAGADARRLEKTEKRKSYASAANMPRRPVTLS